MDQLLSFGPVLILMVSVGYLAWSECRFTRHLAEQCACYSETSYRRSRDLLRALVGEQAYRTMQSRMFLAVPSPHHPGRVYYVPTYGQGMVTVFENDRCIGSLCLQPVRPLPSGDWIIMHKLMIEADEEAYLARANLWFRTGRDA
jgi:hypothetical protein